MKLGPLALFALLTAVPQAQPKAYFLSVKHGEAETDMEDISFWVRFAMESGSMSMMSVETKAPSTPINPAPPTSVPTIAAGTPGPTSLATIVATAIAPPNPFLATRQPSTLDSVGTNVPTPFDPSRSLVPVESPTSLPRGTLEIDCNLDITGCVTTMECPEAKDVCVDTLVYYFNIFNVGSSPVTITRADLFAKNGVYMGNLLVALNATTLEAQEMATSGYLLGPYCGDYPGDAILVAVAEYNGTPCSRRRLRNGDRRVGSS